MYRLVTTTKEFWQGKVRWYYPKSRVETMARPKDIDSKKKRTKTVLLSKPAFRRYRQIKAINEDFNFSEFVNRQMIKAFRDDGDLELLTAAMNELQEDRNKQIAEFDEKIRELALKIGKIRNKRAQQRQVEGESYLNN